MVEKKKSSEQNEYNLSVLPTYEFLEISPYAYL